MNGHLLPLEQLVVVVQRCPRTTPVPKQPRAQSNTGADDEDLHQSVTLVLIPAALKKKPQSLKQQPGITRVVLSGKKAADTASLSGSCRGIVAVLGRVRRIIAQLNNDRLQNRTFKTLFDEQTDAIGASDLCGAWKSICLVFLPLRCLILLHLFHPNVYNNASG